MLRARPRHHRQEPPLVVGDQTHVAPVAELAVGHIQEVGTADDLAERPPGLAVDLAIRGVAVVNLAVDGHGPVGSHRAVVEQLLEIGPVIFVVAVGDARRALVLHSGRLVGKLPGESDGGRVLVHLVPGELEGADGAQGHGGQQTGALGAKQVVQGTPTAVVVEPSALFGKEAEVFRDEARGPGGDAVEGLTGQQEVAEQDTQDGGGRQLGLAAGQTRQVPIEQAGQVKPLQEAAHHRCSANLKGFMAQTSRQRGHRRGSHGNLATTRQAPARRCSERGQPRWG